MAYQPRSHLEDSYVCLSQKSTLTSKGQVTIPQKIREAIHANSGDQIEFTLNESGEVILRAIKKDSLLSLFGSMPAQEETILDWEVIRGRARYEKSKGDLL